MNLTYLINIDKNKPALVMFGVSKSVLVVVTSLMLKHGGTVDVCNTKACQSISQRMLSYMDFQVNPCDDFYRFACGHFVDTAEIPDHLTHNSSYSQVDEKLKEQLKTIVYEKPVPDDPLPYRNLKHLFSLCMDEKTINARGSGHAVAMLRKANGWPVLGDWDDKHWDFLGTEIKLRNLSIGGGNLFDVYISIDAKNTSRRVLEVDQAILGLFRQYLVKGEDDPIVKAYFSYMVDIAVMYGADRKTADDQLRQSLLFEIELAKLTVPKEERRDYDRMYNPYELQDLKKEISWIDWDKLLRSIMPVDVPLKENELLIVKEVNYLKNLEHFLAKYPKQVVANYMMWLAAKSMTGMLTDQMRDRTQEYKGVVIGTTAGDTRWKFSDNRVVANYMMWLAAKSMTGMLTDQMRDRTQEYKGVLFGTTARKPRWKECLGLAYSLGTALSSLYINKYFDKTSKKESLRMAEGLRQEMYKLIQEVDWIDNITRSRALYKVLQVNEYIGYPDELLNISKIEDRYKGLVLDGELYLEELLKLAKWRHHYLYRQLREPVDKKDWRKYSEVTEVNGYYILEENSMQIPAGILQLPFFDPQLPKYVNYAAIGFIMSHEITHGLDDQGSLYDFNGDLKNWWTEDSKKIFNEKKTCFIDQYSNFVDTLTRLNLNGINTQGENIADNGAIKIAFRAYQRLNLDEPLLPGLQNYTQDQLFMLSMATMRCARYRPEALKDQITTGVHSPVEFRVNGVLKNFQEFSRIFRCSDKDAMNPKQRCAVW